MILKLIQNEVKNPEVKFFKVKDSASCRTTAIKVQDMRLDAYQLLLVEAAVRRHKNLYAKNFQDQVDYIIIVSDYDHNIIGEAYTSSLEYIDFEKYVEDCNRVISLRRSRTIHEVVDIELG